MADARIIEITHGDVRFKYVRREGAPTMWDMHIWHKPTAEWSNALELDTYGQDVLWQCAATIGVGQWPVRAGRAKGHG
jgi:hypothetical protein